MVAPFARRADEHTPPAQNPRAAAAAMPALARVFWPSASAATGPGSMFHAATVALAVSLHGPIAPRPVGVDSSTSRGVCVSRPPSPTMTSGLLDGTPPPPTPH
ncbi:MAG: hypothetical protein IBJ18_08525, partial [Phycisphaerales bacterium]|nr:hypothetical protein [Phycisphaerales bacterium]